MKIFSSESKNKVIKGHIRPATVIEKQAEKKNEINVKKCAHWIESKFECNILNCFLCKKSNETESSEYKNFRLANSSYLDDGDFLNNSFTSKVNINDSFEESRSDLMREADKTRDEQDDLLVHVIPFSDQTKRRKSKTYDEFYDEKKLQQSSLNRNIDSKHTSLSISLLNNKKGFRSLNKKSKPNNNIEKSKMDKIQNDFSSSSESVFDFDINNNLKSIKKHSRENELGNKVTFGELNLMNSSYSSYSDKHLFKLKNRTASFNINSTNDSKKSTKPPIKAASAIFSDTSINNNSSNLNSGFTFANIFSNSQFLDQDNYNFEEELELKSENASYYNLNSIVSLSKDEIDQKFNLNDGLYETFSIESNSISNEDDTNSSTSSEIMNDNNVIQRKSLFESRSKSSNSEKNLLITDLIKTKNLNYEMIIDKYYKSLNSNANDSANSEFFNSANSVTSEESQQTFRDVKIICITYHVTKGTDSEAYVTSF